MNRCSCFNDVFLAKNKNLIHRDLSIAKRKIIRMIHPDKWSDSRATKFTQMLNQAYENLYHKGYVSMDLKKHSCREFKDLATCIRMMTEFRLETAIINDRKKYGEPKLIVDPAGPRQTTLISIYSHSEKNKCLEFKFRWASNPKQTTGRISLACRFPQHLGTYLSDLKKLDEQKHRQLVNNYPQLRDYASN